MSPIRRMLARRRGLHWLLALALLMKLLIPAGFMPVMGDGSITVELCSGYGPERIAVHLGDAADKGDGHRAGHDQIPCGFFGHAPASMAMVDPVLLAIAIALIFVAVVHQPCRLALGERPFLRPPLRGPPAAA